MSDDLGSIGFALDAAVRNPDLAAFAELDSDLAYEAPALVHLVTDALLL